MAKYLRISPQGTRTDIFFNTEQIAAVKVDDDILMVKLSTGDEHTFTRDEVPEPAVNKFIGDLTKG